MNDLKYLPLVQIDAKNSAYSSYNPTSYSAANQDHPSSSAPPYPVNPTGPPTQGSSR